jgi:hypothetical protein
MIKNWRDVLPIHPAADLFPLMDAQRLAELVEDIRTNGLQHSIVLCDGKILDGRNRYLACQKAKIEPAFIDYVGDPFAYAWSSNGQRRDLVADQRYLIWKRCTGKSAEWQATQQKNTDEANRKRSESQKGIPKAERVGTTCAETLRDHQAEEQRRTRTSAAKASGTNRGAVERMNRLEANRPDLADKVVAGEMKPKEAMRQMTQSLSRLPKGKD